jgi:hypothetical protein
MLAPVTYIQPLTTLRRQRLLPVEGHVLVNLGDHVRSADPVARANLYTKHLMLDAGRALGLPADRVSKLIQRSVGENVEQGVIIAGRRGVGARQLRAPAGGQIAAISEGQILLQVSDESALLPARVPGEIIDIDPGRGVTIESVCAWVQGVWGNGRFADGNLQIMADNPTHQLTADQIDMSLRGVILLAGSCSQRQALELAAQVPIRGLILASLATRLLPIAEKMPYPIVLIEGFGQAPMNTDAFKLFGNHNGAAATLNAQRNDRFNGERPEVIIPLKDAGRPPQPVPMQSFRLGQNVRVLSGETKGALGEIASLLPASTLFASGLRAPGADIDLANGGHVRVPLANLELLG